LRPLSLPPSLPLSLSLTAGDDRSNRELVLLFESSFAEGLGDAACGLEGSTDAGGLAAASTACQGLHQSVAAASSFLPAQTLERATRSLAELEASIRAKKEQIAPKKKFSFKARDKLAPALPPPSVLDTPPVSVPTAPTPAPAGPRGHDGAEVRGRRGETIIVAPPRGSGGDMALSDLVDCDITLLEGVAALWVDKLVRCRVVSLPIAGAVHITGCEGCAFHVASRQIRIHQTARTNFYLHAGSHPIIEACSGLRFAPYSKAADVAEEMYTAAGLAKDGNLWNSVDDFLWLRAQQSPNWQVLPEAERVAHDTAWPTAAKVP